MAHQLGGDPIQERADHAGETERTTRAHGIDGGFADGGPAEQPRGVERRQQGGAFVQVLRHHAQAGGDDPTRVATFGQDVDGGGRPHADDDGGRPGDELGPDAIGQAILADFARRRVIKPQPAHRVMAKVIKGKPAASSTGWITAVTFGTTLAKAMPVPACSRSKPMSAAVSRPAVGSSPCARTAHPSTTPQWVCVLPTSKHSKATGKV